jgi:hypothetical protein
MEGSKQIEVDRRNVKEVNLLLVNDREMFGNGFARTLENQPDFRVVAGKCAISCDREAISLPQAEVKGILLKRHSGRALFNAVRRVGAVNVALGQYQD